MLDGMALVDGGNQVAGRVDGYEVGGLTSVRYAGLIGEAGHGGGVGGEQAQALFERLRR